MFTLPRTLTFTPARFAEVCAANPEAVLELDADGLLIEMGSTGGAMSAWNSSLVAQLQNWARSCGNWIVFDSSGGFLLPDGSVRSPDASVVQRERWQTLNEAEREGFPPLCPDLVVELASRSDNPEFLRRKMSTYLANGARLVWLLLPPSQRAEVWTPGQGGLSPTPVRVLSEVQRLEAGVAFPGLALDLSEIWDA